MTLRRLSAIRIAMMIVLLAAVSEGYSDPPSSRPATSRPATTTASRRKLPKGFTAKKITLPDGSTRTYAVFLPAQYKLDESHKWPLILALHGSGEIGQDGIKQTTVGLAPYIAARPTRFPFIVVFPQAHTMWFRGAEETAVWAMLDAALKEYRVDTDRIYLTGLSMGGFATWEFAAVRPDAFAAIVPICGAGPLGYMSNIAQLPIWAFHGAIDPNVPVARTRELIAELKQAGAEPRYTEYPNAGHDSWDPAYATPELWRWLLKQKRQTSPRTIDYKMSTSVATVWWLVAEAEPDAKDVPHIRVEIGDAGRVNIHSEHVIAWAISPGPDLIPRGQEIEVVWNDKPAYKGEFKGMLGYGVQVTSQPAK